MRVGWRVAAALGLGAAAALLVGHPAHAAAHRAGLVIEHASSRLVSRCVSFLEDQISGFQLIQRSGLSYQAQGFGSLGEAICQLDAEPASVPANCFGTGPYWQYLHRVGGRWVPSQAGASGWTLHDGDLDGWHYASGTGQTLPAVTLAQVCAPAPRPVTPPSAPAPTPSPVSATTAPPVTVVLLPTTGPTPTGKPTAASPADPALGVLGGSLLILAGLTAWNLLRRGP